MEYQKCFSDKLLKGYFMDTLLLEKKEGVAKVTINRPEVRNILDYETHLKLMALFKGELAEDEEIRVVILTGAGNKAFCAGADISIFKQITDAAKAVRRIDHVEGLLESIEGLDKPVIAMVNGHALGLGLLPALASDIAIASEEAKFGLPLISVAIAGGVARLAHNLGEKKVKELAMLGNPISAKEAEKLGLVNKVVKSEELEAEVSKVAKELKSKSPLTLKMIKRTVNLTFRSRESLGLTYDAMAQTFSLLTEDVQEGVTAFFEKRPPVWKGK
jgi:enoyl-CoA hydratase/carnithine racemase